MSAQEKTCSRCDTLHRTATCPECGLPNIYVPANAEAPRIHRPWAYARRGLELVG